jgi:hypothetical protein
MADIEEIEIKLKVDDSEVKKAIKDETPVAEKSMGGKGGSKSPLGGMNLKGGIGTNISGGLGTAASFAGGSTQQAMQTGIMQMMSRFLPKLLPKILLKFIPIIGTAFAAAEIIPIIIKAVVKQLTAVGAPFDKRFKRIIKKEVNGFFTREEQQRRRLGLDQVIMTTTGGFRNNGGLQTVNTLNQVRETGIATIGLQDKAIGVQ